MVKVYLLVGLMLGLAVRAEAMISLILMVRVEVRVSIIAMV